MDRGAWWATVHAVTKSRTKLSDFHTHTHTHTHTILTSTTEILFAIWDGRSKQQKPLKKQKRGVFIK